MAFENVDNKEIVNKTDDYNPDKRVDTCNNQMLTETNLFNPDQRLDVAENPVNDTLSNNSETAKDTNSESGINVSDSSSGGEIPVSLDDSVHKDSRYRDSEFVGKQNDTSENYESGIKKETETAAPYKDDNGKIYRDADSLLPNNEYVKNGYQYKTDNKGRIVSAEGKLQSKDHDGRSDMPDNMNKVGKGDQKKTDDRGHLIADQFNGSGDIANLVPMNGELNRGDYAKLENKLADAVKAGDDVRFRVDSVYSDNSYRPSEFKVSYRINGEKDTVVFKNGGDSK